MMPTLLSRVIARMSGYLSLKATCFEFRYTNIPTIHTSEGQLNSINDEHDYSEVIAMVDGEIIMVVKLAQGNSNISKIKALNFKCDRNIKLLRAKVLNESEKEKLYEFHERLKK